MQIHLFFPCAIKVRLRTAASALHCNGNICPFSSLYDGGTVLRYPTGAPQKLRFGPCGIANSPTREPAVAHTMSSVLNIVTQQPLSKLTTMMSWANRGNAVLLVLTGLFGIFGAFSHPGADMFSSLLLSLYVGFFGGLLLRYETAAGIELRQDYGFMYTYVGRAAFLLLVANLAWTCRPFGLVAAIITNANALVRTVAFPHRTRRRKRVR